MHGFSSTGCRYRRQFFLLTSILLALGFFAHHPALCSGQDAKQAKRQVWIYRNALSEDDRRSETERLFEFAPYGIMPADRATRVAVDVASPIDTKDAKKGTAVEVLCAIDKITDWEGTYWLLDNGTAWGTKCHWALQNRPLMGASKPASERGSSH